MRQWSVEREQRPAARSLTLAVAGFATGVWLVSSAARHAADTASPTGFDTGLTGATASRTGSGLGTEVAKPLRPMVSGHHLLAAARVTTQRPTVETPTVSPD